MSEVHNGPMIAWTSDKAHVRRPILTPALVLLIAVAVVFLYFDIVVITIDAGSLAERIILHTIVLASSLLACIIYFWRKTGRDFFSFINIVLIAYVLMFLIPILLLVWVPGTATKGDYWDFSSIEYSIKIVILSLYSLIFGYQVAMKKQMGVTFSLGTRPSLRRVQVVFFILAVFWVMYYAAKSSAMGIPPWKLLGYHTRYSELFGKEFGTGIYSVINVLGESTLYIFLLCFILPRDRSVTKGMIAAANLFIVLYMVNKCIIGFYMTAKSTVFFVFFIFFCFMHYTKKRVRLAGLVLLGCIMIPTVLYFNYQRTPPENYPKGEDTMHLAARMYMQSFEDFETLCVVTTNIPRNVPYSYGRRFFEQVVYFPIPRGLWPEKPVRYGGRAVLYDIAPWFFDAGYCIGLQSQLYADLGICGVVAGSLFFGWLIGWVYDTFRRHWHNRGIVILYASIVVNTWLYFKGEFPWLNLILLCYLPICILLWYIYPVKVKNT